MARARRRTALCPPGIPREAKLPLLWVLTGPKAGDNAQVLRAAEASGLPFEIRKVAIRAERVSAKPGIGPSLADVDAAASDPLTAPWPDAVLAIGRHMSCVALWIKQQSGGRTRIALFNAPKGRWGDFDLVVLPAFYRSFARGNARNILPIRMPLIAIPPERLATAGEPFPGALEVLRRPLHVLLVGGDMGQRKLEPGFMAGVLKTMTAGFAEGGTIYASTSRRTPAAVTEAIAQGLRPGDHLYRWGTEGAANPYLFLLAQGDSFTVTADSLSMLIEVARLGKPLMIAEPPAPRGVRGMVQRMSDLLRPRDLGKALELLYESGNAVPLGRGMVKPAAPLPDDTERVAERLRQLAGVKS